MTEYQDPKDEKTKNDSSDVEVRRVSAAAGMALAGAAFAGVPGLIIAGALGVVAGQLFIEEDGDE